MKTKTLLLLLWLVVTGKFFAQDANADFTNRMNYIFQYVDRNKVATGLLADYGAQPLELEYFNGVPADSNYVDMDAWKMLYAGIYSSKFNNNASLTIPETVFSTLASATSGTAVPLAVMHYEYNKLDDNAANRGLVQVSNDQIREVPGAASPYFTRQLFAVAPKSLSFDGPTASFVFLSSLRYTNVSKPIQTLAINFNNESGYLPTSWGSPISYTFASGGVKTIWFRLTYTDGSSYTSRTNVTVTAQSSLTRNAANGFTDIDFPASSLHSGGLVQIRYSSSNTSGKIKKPLIIAEGFDPSSVVKSIKNIDLKDFIKSGGSNSFGTIDVPLPGSTQDLLPSIDLAQFDLVYLDYKNGLDDIRRNAQLFREVIQWVNQNKQGTEKNVVMGVSMGGLVARYALRKMEMSGEDHQTSKFISMDSPHKGANVPVGYQAALRHVGSMNLKVFFVNIWKSTDDANIKGAVDLLNSMAARQMLIYWVDSDLNYDNSVHNSFMSEYESMGFPQNCQNVAITNGSQNATLTFSPGSQLVDMSDTYTLKWWMEWLNVSLGPLSTIFLSTNYPSLVLNMLPGKTQIRAQVSIDALKGAQSSQVYSGSVHFRKKILWVIQTSVTLTEKKLNSTSSMLPVDGAPGGIYSIDNIGDLPIDASNIKQKQFCFIPTVSALALSNWESLLTSNLSGTDFYGNGNTKFQRYSMPTSNELHTRFNSSASFLYYELTKFSSVISGPKTVCSSATYSIDNLPAGLTVQWNSSSNVSRVSAQGVHPCTFAAAGDGPGWIEATVNGALLPRKTVCVGKPNAPTEIFDFFNNGMQFGSNSYCDFSVPIQDSSTSYTWNVGGGRIVSGQGSPTITVLTNAVSKTGAKVYFSVGVKAKNDCGESGLFQRTGWVMPGLTSVLKTVQAPSNPTGENEPNTNLAAYVIQLYNDKATLVRTITSSEPTSETLLQGLPSGVYIMQISKGGKIISSKKVFKD